MKTSNPSLRKTKFPEPFMGQALGKAGKVRLFERCPSRFLRSVVRFHTADVFIGRDGHKPFGAAKAAVPKMAVVVCPGPLWVESCRLNNEQCPEIGSSRGVSGSHQLVMTSYRYPEVRRGISGLFFYPQTPAMRRGFAVKRLPRRQMPCQSHLHRGRIH